jgi:hypothetical protein
MGAFVEGDIMHAISHVGTTVAQV